MEKKKTQRIIGILVIIALVIVVMPLLFSKNDLPTQEAVNEKAPPFPEQTQNTTTVASVANDSALPSAVPTAESATPSPTTVANQTAAPVASEKLPEPPALSAQTQQAENVARNTPQPAVPAAPSNDNPQDVTITQEMADKLNPTAKNNKPSSSTGGIVYEPVTHILATVAASKAITSTAPIKLDNMTADANSSQTLPAKPMPILAKAKPYPHKKSITTASMKKSVAAAQVAGWAVQMGNFRVKRNAVHLAGVLRAAGYKAFTREIKSANGMVSTRVYIGPENRSASAKKLSNDVSRSMNMHGIVVPFKHLDVV